MTQQIDYSNAPCKSVIVDNIKAVEQGKELTAPLSYLNRSCEFRQAYNKYLLVTEGLPVEVKAYKKAYYQKPEVKAHIKAYKKAYYQKIKNIKCKANSPEKTHE